MPAKPSQLMPWEQRRGEPATAYTRFVTYRSLGPARSLAQAAEQCGVSLGRLKQLSSEWNWHSRAAAWDRHCYLQRRGQEVEGARRARQRLLQEAADWQSLARQQIASWVRRGSDGQLRLTRELTPSEALRLWRVGSQAELTLREIVTIRPDAAASRFARSPVEHEVDQMREAVREASSSLVPYGTEYRQRQEIEDALWDVMKAWLHTSEHVGKHGTDDHIGYVLWPWHVPLAQA